MLRAVNTAVVLQICIFLLMKSVFGMAQTEEYKVSFSPASAMLKKGENLTALCNIPGLSALDIVTKFKVRLFHNGRQLTSLCEFEEPSMFEKYACSVLFPQANNISLEFTVRNVQKADEGNLTCEVFKRVKEGGKWVRDEFVAKKSVAIKSTACNPGSYGKDCKEVCGHCEGNEPCNHINGSCPGSCEPGYAGEMCLTKCGSGSYGRNCNSACGHCAHNATCDPITGACPDCAPGWTGSGDNKCDRACNDGWYGRECKQRCGYCRGDEPCHHVTGSCSGFCEPGYLGDKCDESEFSQLLAIQRNMLNSVRELLSFKRRKVGLIANITSPTDLL